MATVNVDEVDQGPCELYTFCKGIREILVDALA